MLIAGISIEAIWWGLGRQSEIMPPFVGWVVAGIGAVFLVYALYKLFRRRQLSGRRAIFAWEDAQDIYQNVSQKIRELREMAEIVNEENKDKPDPSALLFRDKRMIKILAEIEKEREKCRDRELDEWLGRLLNLERKQLRWSINPYDRPAAEALDNAHQNIRDYINKKFKRRS